MKLQSRTPPSSDEGVVVRQHELYISSQVSAEISWTLDSVQIFRTIEDYSEGMTKAENLAKALGSLGIKVMRQRIFI